MNQSPTKLVAMPAMSVINAPAPEEIVEGIAWAGYVSALISESGAGKTFLALDMGAAVDADIKWHGRTVRHGSVVYINFEGDAIGLRLQALCEVVGRRLRHFYVVRAHDPISPAVTREGEVPSAGETAIVAVLKALAAELEAAGLPPIVLIVIDTVRASMSGSEDGSDHVAAYIRAVRRILATCPGSACVIAHHSGWQDGDTARKRERGSSAWRGNCDATLYLEAGAYDRDKGEAEIALRSLKTRDAEPPLPLHLIRRTVELPRLDRQGRPVTSCVIESDLRSHEDRKAEAQAAVEKEQQDVDLKVLCAIADHPEMSTSQDRLRVLLGVRKSVVAESVSRLVRLGWVIPGPQRKPYTVTESGAAAVERVVPSSSRVVPGTVPSSSPGSPYGGPGTTERNGSSSSRVVEH